MDCNNTVFIILFVVVLIIIYLLCKINKLEQNQKEKFSQTKDISLTESIKNLGLVAKKIQDAQGNLVFPADVVIKGNLKVEGSDGIKAYREVGVYNNRNLTGDKIAVENKEDGQTKIYSQKNIKITKNDSNNITVEDQHVHFNNIIHSNKDIISDTKVRVKGIRIGEYAEMKVISSASGSVGDSAALFGFQNSEDAIKEACIQVGSGSVKLIHKNSKDNGVSIQAGGYTEKGRLICSIMRPGNGIGEYDRPYSVDEPCYKYAWANMNADPKRDMIFLRESDKESERRFGFIAYHKNNKSLVRLGNNIYGIPSNSGSKCKNGSDGWGNNIPAAS